MTVMKTLIVRIHLEVINVLAKRALLEMVSPALVSVSYPKKSKLHLLLFRQGLLQIDHLLEG